MCVLFISESFVCRGGRFSSSLVAREKEKEKYKERGNNFSVIIAVSINVAIDVGGKRMKEEATSLALGVSV